MVKTFDGPTLDQVIRWAISSGTICGSRDLALGATERLERLAALAYAAGQEAEREACAKFAESAEIPISVEVWMGAKKALTAATAIGIAAAIRARGNK